MFRRINLPNVQPVPSVQVRVLWGDNPIHITELTPPRRYVVGERDADFMVPSEQLGVESLELLSVSGEQVWVTAPADASVHFQQTEGKEPLPLPALSGELLRGTLQRGQTARITRGQLTFEVSVADAMPRAPRAFSDGALERQVGYFGASFLSVGALLGSMAFLVPPMGLNDGEGVDDDQLIVIQQYLEASAEREEERQEERASEDHAEESGGTGAQAEGREGEAGKPEVARQNKTWGKKGPKDNPDPALSKLEQAKTFGMIGLLAGGSFGDPDAPSAPWGRDHALGRDEVSAMGNMWGDEIGESGGSAGLGLFSNGIGGGGKYQGIGLGEVGTLGRGSGSCDGDFQQCQGFGNSRGRIQGHHQTQGIRVAMAQPTVSGRIPPEIIQRRVRQNFGRFRYCYEQGLIGNPNLSGRVSVRFLISSQGTVASASSSGSSLPSSDVTNCVVRAFYGISFPKPDVGSVSVTYPIVFSPS